MRRTAIRLRLAGALAAVLVAGGIATGPAAQAGEEYGKEPTLADLAQRHGRYSRQRDRQPRAGRRAVQGPARQRVRPDHARQRHEVVRDGAPAGRVRLLQGRRDREPRPRQPAEGARTHPGVAQPAARVAHGAGVDGPRAEGRAEEACPGGGTALPGQGVRLGRGQRGVQRGRYVPRVGLLQDARVRLHRRRPALGASGRSAREAVPQRLQHRGDRPEERRLLQAGQGAEGQGRPAARHRPPGSSGPAVRLSRPPCRTTSAASPGSASTPRSPRSTYGCNCPRPRRSWPSRPSGTGT